ncbi:MAG TPA: 16S rRNA (cytosine(1402)-N(4))-methyltransferase RsmH [Anaerolineales bacterium]|nr:16S rRNA (cytosine(1402)-N(4))-methyltransferase RsmH [Anaerolineales bacterium]HRQ92822.1 16S rRNA (cytosine(1402)-N(4))-methyltransferase RsmH [Anaerolineales bacterium]
MSIDDRGPAAHLSVLYKETLEALSPTPGGRYVDGTLGAGGHAWGLLEGSRPDGQLLGLDVDPHALALATQRLAPFGERAHIRHGSYADLAQHLAALGWGEVDGILLDLGASSMQFDQAERGFSFQKDGPLDMRFNPAAARSAADLVNTLPEAELADLLYAYGEERQSRRIARAIVAARPLHTSRALAELVAKTLGGKRTGVHPATRSFQALRIAVNGELDAVQTVLPQAVAALKPGGRLAIISFHSLEDRLVKQYFRQESRDCICPPGQPVCTCGHAASLKELSRKPLAASEQEIAANPRARSAHLRVAERLAAQKL